MPRTAPQPPPLPSALQRRPPLCHHSIMCLADQMAPTPPHGLRDTHQAVSTSGPRVRHSTTHPDRALSSRGSSTPTQSARRRIGCSSDTAAACTRECFLINDHPGRPTLVYAIQSLQSSSKHSRNPSSATLSPALAPHAASSWLRPSHLRSSTGLTQHALPSGQTHVRACPGA